MPKQLIITDDVNIDSKDIGLLSYDSIYKKDRTKVFTHDSKSGTSVVKSGIYALLSTSDKSINNRLYDYDSLKSNVVNGDWLKPFKKPFLRNHDLYSDMPSGRIIKSWFVDHETLEVSKPKSQDDLPTPVLDFYKNLKCFDNGTGSTIVEIAADENTYERVKNGFDATVSQSSYMGKAVCNICHQDYFSGECNHYTGREYQIEVDKQTIKKICNLECSDFEPIELSIVNNPANDTSILFVYEHSSNNSNNSDNKNEKNEIKDTEIDNSLNKDKIEETEKNKKQDIEVTEDKENKNTEEVMFKDLLKNTISKSVSDRFGEEVKDPFAQLFDSLEKEEQVSNLQKFLDALELSLDNEEDTNEEPEESNNDNKETKEPEESKNTADGAGNTGEEDKKDTKDSEEKDPDKKSEAEDEKDTKEETKADDLKDIYDSKNVVIKDTQLNKKVEAILNIL